jgi:hypothetical protein
MTEDLAPGELVSVSPERPDAVQRSRRAEDATVIGVVSTVPGVLLGAPAFSLERMEQNWGRGLVERFEAERATWEQTGTASCWPVTDPAVRRKAAKWSAASDPPRPASGRRSE